MASMSRTSQLISQRLATEHKPALIETVRTVDRHATPAFGES
jgi:hypothetical protein